MTKLVELNDLEADIQIDHRLARTQGNVIDFSSQDNNPIMYVVATKQYIDDRVIYGILGVFDDRDIAYTAMQGYYDDMDELKLRTDTLEMSITDFELNQVEHYYLEDFEERIQGNQ